MSESGRDISFTGRACPDRFRLRTITLQPADAMDYVSADWADAVVVVERGSVEIECSSGGRATFAKGAVLVFDGMPLRRLRNVGDAPLVLSALSRSRPSGKHIRRDR